ncbi:ATP-binding cassette domain-containing protein [Halosegnis marinus]|uniref:ATP-binding cassette domain-containing protein n=1 Tax=Halosegnis marinus TaxID=3034023 RepID=UPI00362185E9
MIAAHGVGFGYGDERVLADVSLAAEPGETFALIGPSGTGKTTLLRLLALFDPPEGNRHRRRPGRVDAVAGGADAGAPARRHGVPEPVAVLDERRPQRRVRTRRQAVVDRPCGTLAPGAGRRAAPARVGRRGARHGGAPGKVRDPASSLSAGEAQRVAFARALATEPEVLLLDEPTSNLDPRNTALIEEAVDAARDRDIAVVIATHDMQQAERIADRVGVMLDGTLIEQGPAAEVFDAPDDDRARAFIDGELVY